jgi:hypothetical protein
MPVLLPVRPQAYGDRSLVLEFSGFYQEQPPIQISLFAGQSLP